MIETILIVKPTKELEKAIANETDKGDDRDGSTEPNIEDILKDSKEVPDTRL